MTQDNVFGTFEIPNFDDTDMRICERVFMIINSEKDSPQYRQLLELFVYPGSC